MEYTEFKAKTIAEAITKASLAFSVVSARIDYIVVQEATTGFLGIGAKPCIIKARPMPEEPVVEEKEKPAPKQAPKAATKVAPKTAPKTAPKAEPVKTEMVKASEKPAEAKISEIKKEEPPVKDHTAEPEKPAVQNSQITKSDNRYVSMDEIELRAARAAAK